MAHQRNLLYMNLLSDFLASETQMLQPEALLKLLDQRRHRPNILRENKLQIPDRSEPILTFPRHAARGPPFLHYQLLSGSICQIKSVRR